MIHRIIPFCRGPRPKAPAVPSKFKARATTPPWAPTPRFVSGGGEANRSVHNLG